MNGNLLLLSRTNRSLDPRDVQRIGSDAARRTDIETKVTPHILRHTFATRSWNSVPSGRLAQVAVELNGQAARLRPHLEVCPSYDPTTERQ